MRFLTVNLLRLGARTAGIPYHLQADLPAVYARDVLARIVDIAVDQQVHAVFLTGEVFAADNDGLEPLGPLKNALHTLSHANIPVVAVAHGRFTPDMVASLGLADTVTFVDGELAWRPPITTGTDFVEGGAIHILNSAVTEYDDTPGDVISLAELDHPDAIWLLTAPKQPDLLRTDNALIIEPGSPIALNPNEINRHGVWLVDTDAFDAHLIPTAPAEFTAIDIDVSNCEHLDDVEQAISQALAKAGNDALGDDSAAQFLLVDITLTGATRLYPGLPALADELRRAMQLEHAGLQIAITDIHIDATPSLDLEPLLQRPDPVGELARLITVLQSNDERSPSQQAIIATAEQRLLAVKHARVFGGIHDTELDHSAEDLLARNAWAMLDSLVRQRGIDR